MGPGGVGTSRALPTKGLRTLLGYYGGEGPSREKLATFIREFLVYDGRAVPDELVDVRYEASIQPEVMANPPLLRPSSLRTLLRMDLTRDRRLARLGTPTLVIWGTEDKVNRAAGGLTLARTMPRCDLFLASRTGHWVQWERPELFNSLALDFLGGKDGSA
jgi:4,5:9,10-diseco-3-hydroxy-5,9,17-trioxoandrosta-1(10),2-diene-4-oate hydrolase